ncbi:hypothetical protein [Gordonia rhizosphera]|uniref:Uncharacterized protein n=1 Tax=Gordonia rhizosphera NBRC 16068 TaxID=1108045 RepID=K6V4U7_9ACTN|nr:hypothetical protein [Gordonia rhizosphera]GAB91208.1 hypothetical protein GORHZ_125_00920 [Gordonia rhizosphera NBRC 16068]
MAVTREMLTDVRTLILEAPGDALLRIATEASLVRGGGEPASSPAAANALVLCGEIPDRFDELVERLWQQMPYPKTRVTISDPPEIADRLSEVARSIRDLPAQRAAALRDGRASMAGQNAMSAGDMGGHDGHDMSEHEMGGHDGHDMSEHEMGGHDGHDMSEHDMSDHDSHDMSEHEMSDHDMSHHDHMSMSGPGGYPLAMGDDDRDGLEMDVLNRTLGPFLPDWDPRLLVHVVLAGDLVRSAEAEIVSPIVSPRAGAPGPDDEDSAVLRLDSAARLLHVAGWGPVADRMTRARDAAFDGRRDDALRDALRCRTRIARSPLLRWVFRGLRIRDIALGDLLLRAVDDAVRLLRDEPASTSPPTLTAEQIGDLVTGRDLGTARLLLAAVHPAMPDVGAAGSGHPTTSGHETSAGHHAHPGHEGMHHG